MKELNKLIRHTIFEIIFVIGFLIVSEPLWQKVYKETKIADSIALSGSTYIEVDNPINYLMQPMSDEKAVNYLKPCHITVKNSLTENTNYTLALKISKESTMDLNNIHILVNDNIYNLVDLNTVNEEENIYYILAESNLKNNDNEYNIIFWLTENANYSTLSQELLFNFEIIKSNMEI